MNKRSLFFLLIMIWGCSALPGVKGSVSSKTLPTPGDQSSPVPSEVEEKPPTGTIFAKTVFEGVVKTSYVRLLIMDESDATKTYQLYIGDKARQKNFPWKVQTVSPGYFFIELPPGKYQIHNISIPVGTTLATEPMDIHFEVFPDRIIYLGTLKVIGTKEKIRFGGVPVINPGFEYRVEILDEREEAFQELHQRFPNLKGTAVINILKILKKTNLEDSLSHVQ